MYQCPVCGELLEALTNVHCLARHQTTRQDFIERYGSPKFITPKISREVQRWIRESQVITRMDYDVAQASARNQLGRKS